MCGLTAGLLIASAAIAATTATSSAVVQKKQSDRQKEFEADRQRKIDAQAAQENAFYRMEYYRDPMRTAEGANTLKQIREYNQRMTDIQQNRNVITGGTHEQTIAQQGRAMDAYSSAVSNIRQQAERSRRIIGQQWMGAQSNQFTRQMNADAAVNQLRQQSMSNAISNINNFGTAAQGAISSAIQVNNVRGAGGNMKNSGSIFDVKDSDMTADQQYFKENYISTYGEDAWNKKKTEYQNKKYFGY